MQVIAIVVAGLAVVLLTSLIKNVEWSPRHKNLVATILSVIAAGLVFATGIDFGTVASIDLVEVIMGVYGTSQLIYNFILSGTGLESRLAGKSEEPEV